VRGDALTARLSKRSQQETATQLEMVGRLLQFFRQMDAAMASEEMVGRVREAFIAGNFAFWEHESVSSKQ
jgi:hypothetical protein